MGGALIKAAKLAGLTVSKAAKKKKAAAASADKPAKADRAAMAAPSAVEYAGKDTDKTTPRRKRRQVRGRPAAGQRKSLLAEQSDSKMKTKLGS